MSDEYDLKPIDDKPKPAVPPENAPADAASSELPPGFVPPKVIIEPPDEEPEDPEVIDATENKGAAVLAYLCFLVPLVYAPKSNFARYHANQALILQLHMAALVFVFALIKAVNHVLGSRIEVVGDVMGWVSCLALPAVFILLLVLLLAAAQQALSAMDLERKQIPVIGKFVLLKPLMQEENEEEKRER